MFPGKIFFWLRVQIPSRPPKLKRKNRNKKSYAPRFPLLGNFNEPAIPELILVKVFVPYGARSWKTTTPMFNCSRGRLVDRSPRWRNLWPRKRLASNKTLWSRSYRSRCPCSWGPRSAIPPGWGTDHLWRMPVFQSDAQYLSRYFTTSIAPPAGSRRSRHPQLRWQALLQIRDFTRVPTGNDSIRLRIQWPCRNRSDQHQGFGSSTANQGKYTS